MKHAAAVAAMFALLAFPAMAQRGGARGGGGGHASGGFAGHAGGFSGHAGFSGGFSAPHFGNFASHSPGFAPRYGGFAPRGFAPRGFMAPGRTGFAPRTRTSAGRMPYRENGYGRLGNAYAANGRNRYGGDHGRGPHHRPYYNRFNGLPYAYDYGAWPYGFEIDPCSLEPDWLDSDNWDGQDYACGDVPAPYPDYGESGLAYGDAAQQYGEAPQYGEGAQYGEPAPQSDQAQFGPEQYAAPQPDAESDQQQSEPAPWPRQPYTGGNDNATPQQAVTLILKNGRQPETIHNYILTANTLTVLDHGYRQIPVDQIDVPATEAANRANGINFHVPGAADK